MNNTTMLFQCLVLSQSMSQSGNHIRNGGGHYLLRPRWTIPSVISITLQIPQKPNPIIIITNASINLHVQLTHQIPFWYKTQQFYNNYLFYHKWTKLLINVCIVCVFLSRESEIKHIINYKLLLIYISLNKNKIT